MKIYNDLDLQGNNLLNVANMPQFMLDIKLLHARNIGQQVRSSLHTLSRMAGLTLMSMPR